MMLARGYPRHANMAFVGRRQVPERAAKGEFLGTFILQNTNIVEMNMYNMVKDAHLVQCDVICYLHWKS